MNIKSLQFFLLIFSMLNVWSYTWCSGNIEQSNIEPKYSLSEMPTNIIEQIGSYLPPKEKRSLGMTEKQMLEHDIPSQLIEKFLLAPYAELENEDARKAFVDKLNSFLREHRQEKTVYVESDNKFKFANAIFLSLFQWIDKGTEQEYKRRLSTIMSLSSCKDGTWRNIFEALKYAKEHSLDKINVLFDPVQNVTGLLEGVLKLKYTGLVFLRFKMSEDHYAEESLLTPFSLHRSLYSNIDPVMCKDLLQRTPLYAKTRSRVFKNFDAIPDKTPLNLLIERFNQEEQKEWIEIADLLIEYGIDINAQDIDGRTALVYAISEINEVMFQYLLSHGANPNIKDFKRRTVLYYLLHKIFTEELVPWLSTLIEYGIDINAQDIDGATALDYAISEINEVMFQYLLLHGADPNIKDSEKCTALYYPLNNALSSYLAEEQAFWLSTLVEQLIPYHIDINTQDNKGRTPLHHYCLLLEEYYSNQNRVEDTSQDKLGNYRESLILKVFFSLLCSLLKHGANQDIQDSDGKRAFDLIRDEFLQRAIRMFKGGITETTLQDGIMLSYMLHSGNIDMIKELLDRGANPQLLLYDLQYHIKHWFRTDSVIGILIEHGADLNGKDDEGRTPLHYYAFKLDQAIEKKEKHEVEILLKCISALIRRYPNLNITDNDGKTFVDLINNSWMKLTVRNMVSKTQDKGIITNIWNFIKSLSGY